MTVSFMNIYLLGFLMSFCNLSCVVEICEVLLLPLQHNDLTIRGLSDRLQLCMKKMHPYRSFEWRQCVYAAGTPTQRALQKKHSGRLAKTLKKK